MTSAPPGTARGVPAAFRWGILGSGQAARKFVLGLRHAEDAVAVVVASRTAANARRFADSVGIPAVAPGYDAAIAGHEVDAFYMAVPPDAHCALALACIAAGRPVLIEKPFAADLAAAEEIERAARSRSVFCMEGVWTRFLPLTRRLKRMVDGGAIGDVRLVTGSFGRPTGQSGGALLHRGIYPLSLATHLLGAPADVLSRATVVDGVDRESVVVARHSGAGMSVSSASLDTLASNDLVIQGTGGTIHVLAPIYRPYRMTLIRAGPGDRSGAAGRLGEGALLHGALQRLGGLRTALSRRSIREFYAGNGYSYEADEVARCVRAGRTESAVMPLADSVAVVAAMTEARRQWSR